MTLSVDSKMRHDMWMQVDKLDTRLMEETDPAVREDLEASRANFNRLLTNLFQPSLVVISTDISKRPKIDDVAMLNAWQEILGEVPPALTRLPFP